MDGPGIVAAEVVGEDPAVLREVSCKGCGARLRYGLRAIYTRGSTDISGVTDYTDYIRCSRCNHEITV